MMLRQGLLRACSVSNVVSIRMCSADITWSTGEKTRPSPIIPTKRLVEKKEYPIRHPDGRIEYFGFDYYPRYPDEVDPPYKPSPLHLVTRIKPIKFRPKWEKAALKRFQLDEKTSQYAIVKNSPENNAHLWVIKHLVKIVPIQLPENLPRDADPRHLRLKETGELTYDPEITLDERVLEEDEELARTKWMGKFIEEHVRRKWQDPWQIKLV